MIRNLTELNDFVVGFCNYVVRYACEHTTSGNYFVDIESALEKVGASFEDFLKCEDLIYSELASREELLEFDSDIEHKEFDINCALDYCPRYEWCEGDEAVFDCSYEEWLARPTKPIIDRPTYSQLLDTNYAQTVAPSVRFYVGDGINLDKDFYSVQEAIAAFKSYAPIRGGICLGVIHQGQSEVLLDNVLGNVCLHTESLQGLEDDIVDELRAYMEEVYPHNDFCVGKWRVHVLTPGAQYGLNNCLTFEDKDSCVEFWDMSQDKERFPEGQFTGGRYYISTLLEDEWGAGPEKLMRHGLCLNGDCADAWSVSGDEMTKVYEWLKNRPLLDGEHYLQCSGTVNLSHSPERAQDWIYDKLSQLVFARDLGVEHVASYDDSDSFAFSFVSQAEKEAVGKALKGLFTGLNYSLDFEAKKFDFNREPLENVIGKCSAQVKDTHDGGGKQPEGR